MEKMPMIVRIKFNINNMSNPMLGSVYAKEKLWSKEIIQK